MRRVVGIDPGLTGGMGVLDLDGGGAVVNAGFVHTPTVRVRRGRRERIEYDVAGMHAMLDLELRGEDNDIHGAEVVIEEQQAMPAALHGRAQGGRSTFRTGYGFGLWLALVVALRAPYRLVRPVAWKRHHGLLGCDKRASRLRAGELFPALAPIRATDEGCAEGLLLAAFAASRYGVAS
jgi:hypothetical protein